jgi:predicted site-specific integrase-resolvase
VINHTEDKTYEQELVDDVLSIITIFSSKLYGSRSHKVKKIQEQSKEMFKEIL